MGLFILVLISFGLLAIIMNISLFLLNKHNNRKFKVIKSRDTNKKLQSDLLHIHLKDDD